MIRVSRVAQVVAGVTVVLVMAGCAAAGDGPSRGGASVFAVDGSAVGSTVVERFPERTETEPVEALDGREDSRPTVEAAVTASFARLSGEVTRRTTTGLNGVLVALVTRLVWDGGSGHTSREFVVDDRYLDDPQVKEFVVSANRELRAEARDLFGAELSDVTATARRAVIELLDGVALEPIGLGWWQGRGAGSVDVSTLRLLIAEGRLRSITRSVDVAGFVGSDTWEFAV